MTSTSKLGDEFLRIPKLDVSGSNWVLYKERFFWALDARAILDHVDGTSQEPTDPVSEKSRKDNKLTDEEKELEKEWKKELKEWKQGEAVTKQQIASSIPDSLFMKIRAKKTAHEIWKELENHFQNRSRMVSVDLRRRIQEIRCAEKGDMIAHFTTLRTMREDLAAMGQALSEDDFYAIILGSLPASYDPYISAVNATSSVLGKTISADDLMLTVTEEYKCRNLRNKTGKKDEDAAFHSTDSGKGQKGGLNLKKKNIECHNCHKKGHYKSECWAPGGGKEGQGPKQKGKTKSDEKKETGAVAETKSKAPAESKGKEKEAVDKAWLAMIDGPWIGDDELCVLDNEEVKWEELEKSENTDDIISTCSDSEQLDELTFDPIDLVVSPIKLHDLDINPFDCTEGAYTSNLMLMNLLAPLKLDAPK